MVEAGLGWPKCAQGQRPAGGSLEPRCFRCPRLDRGWGNGFTMPQPGSKLGHRFLRCPILEQGWGNGVYDAPTWNQAILFTCRRKCNVQHRLSTQFRGKLIWKLKEKLNLPDRQSQMRDPEIQPWNLSGISITFVLSFFWVSGKAPNQVFFEFFLSFELIFKSPSKAKFVFTGPASSGAAAATAARALMRLASN